MTETRKEKSLKCLRARIVCIKRKDKIAALLLSILILQQQLDELNVEEVSEGFHKSLEASIVVGNKVRIIGGLCEMGELCTVTDVTKKCVWVMAHV